MRITQQVNTYIFHILFQFSVEIGKYQNKKIKITILLV